MQRYLTIAILMLMTVLLCGGCVFRSTGETEVGVLTKKLAILGEKGVQEDYYEPGVVKIFPPFVTDWHTFDTKLQNIEMTYDKGRGDRGGRDDLLFKTIDGNDISLDVIISYRIDPHMAPYILKNVAENDQMLREKVVRTVARSKPRDIFGELKTEEFYVADQREQKSQEAKEALKEILEPLGIIVERVLTKDYRFNNKYQEAIEAKKIADQTAEKFKSEQKAIEKEYLKKIEEIAGEVNKMVAKADGEFKKAEIEIDAYYKKQKLLAEAILSEGKAEAEGIRKRNEALAGSGGAAMVKLKIAEALAGKKIVLLPMSEGGVNLKTTDVNGLIQMMGIKSLSQQPAAQ